MGGLTKRASDSRGLRRTPGCRCPNGAFSDIGMGMRLCVYCGHEPMTTFRPAPVSDGEVRRHALVQRAGPKRKLHTG